MTGKKKKAVLILAAFCLTGSSFYGTKAYLNDQEKVENKLEFVGKDGLNAILTEPSWKKEEGLLVVPNTTIQKDPQVTNTSEIDLDELVALQCEFVYTDSCPDESMTGTLLSTQDMMAVTEVFDIDYNSDDPEKEDWVRFEGQKNTDARQCFYYKNTLKRNYPDTGETTVPLFTRLKIDKTVSSSEFAAIQAMGGFDIRISGQVLQQMTGESFFGLDSAEMACREGLFDFESE